MKLDLYKCDYCYGCKPSALVRGILWESGIPGGFGDLVDPEESDKHICRTCIEKPRVKVEDVGR